MRRTEMGVQDMRNRVRVPGELIVDVSALVLYVWVQIRPPPRKIRNHPKIRPVMNSSRRIDPISMLELCLGPCIHGDPASSILAQLW